MKKSLDIKWGCVGRIIVASETSHPIAVNLKCLSDLSSHLELAFKRGFSIAEVLASGMGSYFISLTSGNLLMSTVGGTNAIQLAGGIETVTEAMDAPWIIEGGNSTYSFTNSSTASSGVHDIAGSDTWGMSGARMLTLKRYDSLL
jgi:hypothetical protein